MGVRGKFFTWKAVRYWNSLPREVMDALFLEMFMARLYGALDNLVLDVAAGTLPMAGRVGTW